MSALWSQLTTFLYGEYSFFYPNFIGKKTESHSFLTLGSHSWFGRTLGPNSVLPCICDIGHSAKLWVTDNTF